MEITFQLPPLLTALYIHGCKTTIGSRGKILDRVCQQTGGKPTLNSRGWAICCHFFAQSKSVEENKQMGAVSMKDHSPWRDSPLV